ncbi:MAG: TRAP transporter large permease subunit [Streptosporangiales bacterium]|nr:TRAP transporter large permease subunit [Streptosporangiales bacterium]
MSVSPDITTVVVLVVLLALITLRVPLFLSLGLTGMLGLFLLQGVTGLELAPLALAAQLQDFALVAVPLFILLGEVLAVAGLGATLFETAHKWLNRVPAGLAGAGVGASTFFGAISGVSLSSVAVIGRMAVPAMLTRGYEPAFASGAVVASGALAMLIPPSLMFILYSSITGESVADLFAGGILPGLLLATVMLTYVVVRAVLRPSLAPRSEDSFSWGDRARSLVKVIPALLLIILVLGSIYTGVATPTESAALGAAGAFVIAGVIYRALNRDTIVRILSETTRVSVAVLVIVSAAFVFSKFLVVARIPDGVAAFLVELDVSRYLIMIGIMLSLIVLGCLVDAGSLLLVVTPILVPAIEGLGFDPLWFGVLLVVNLEIAVVTPPVGLNLYAMKSVVPELELGQIIRGVLPYVALEAAVLVTMLWVPGIATWLPELLS